MEKDEHAPEETDVLQAEETTPQPEEAQGSEAQESVLTREEILAMSRKENKNGDERERQYLQKANSMAFATSLFVATIILIVTVIRDDRYPCEIMLLCCASQAVNSLIASRGMRPKMKKLYLVLGIVFVVCSVAFLVLWILQLCGVA